MALLPFHQLVEVWLALVVVESLLSPISSLSISNAASLRKSSTSTLFRTKPFTVISPTTSFSLSTLKSSATKLYADVDASDESLDDEGLGAWIAVGSAAALKGLGPQQITIMGRDFVVWHTEPPKGSDEEVEWSVQADVCPHRLAPLSQGRVDPESGCVECPYHGWQFDTDGTLINIPQLENENEVYRARRMGGSLQNFPVHLAGDLIFAFLPSSIHGEMFPMELKPEQMYPYLAEEIEKETTYYSRVLPYSADMLIENFMDPAHIPYAHHKLQGSRADGLPIEMKELVSNFTHVEVSFKDQSGGKKRDGVLSFQRPGLYHFRTRQEDGSMRPNLKIHIVPVKAGYCRAIYADFTNKVPRFLLHAFSNRFLNTDVWLHDAERLVVERRSNNVSNQKLGGMDYIMVTQSDLAVSSFRKWWMKYWFADSPPHTFSMATPELLGPKLSRSEQIDPWENHVKSCSHCRKALKWMKRLQTASVMGSLMSVVVCRRIPILAFALTGLFLYAQNFFKKFATHLESNTEKSGIADRSVSAALP